MHSRQITIWNCDFCRTHKHTKPAMDRHEGSCTANPNRVCKMCDMAGIAQKTMAELLEVVKEPGTDTERMERLTAATEGCPACILATIRQHKVEGAFLHIDFDEKRKAWVKEYTRYDAHTYAAY